MSESNKLSPTSVNIDARGLLGLQTPMSGGFSLELSHCDRSKIVCFDTGVGFTAQWRPFPDDKFEYEKVEIKGPGFLSAPFGRLGFMARASSYFEGGLVTRLGYGFYEESVDVVPSKIYAKDLAAAQNMAISERIDKASGFFFMSGFRAVASPSEHMGIPLEFGIMKAPALGPQKVPAYPYISAGVSVFF